jgi:hypothetical protein
VDGNRDDLELLLATTRQEVAALRKDRRLAPIEGSRGAALREHVLDLLGAFDRRLSETPSTDAPDPVRKAFARSLRQSMVVLRGAYAALPWLAATRQPTVNLGSLYLTEELAVALVGEDVDLVVVPNPEAMYSTTSWPFSAVIDGTPGFQPSATRRPIVLNYPLSDGDRLLLHPLFAHEIGHASVQEHNLVSLVERRLNDDQEFIDAFEEVVAVMAEQWTTDEATIARTIEVRLRTWIEELLCDHLATEAMGPAFLFAFVCFVMPLSYGEPGHAHPPATLRVRLMLEHLERRGWGTYLGSVAPRVEEWLKTIRDDASASFTGAFADVFTFFRSQLTRNASIIQDTARERLDRHWLDPAITVSEANEVARLLDASILPVGLDQPIPGRAIVLGGWQAALRHHGDRPEGLVHAVADRRLQDLVGKAVEMSTVVSSWRSGK